jgi:hypothetical protein
MTSHYSTLLIYIFPMASQPIQYCTVLDGNTSGDFKLKPMLIYHTTRWHPERWKGILRSTCLSSGSQTEKPGWQETSSSSGSSPVSVQQCSVIARKMTAAQSVVGIRQCPWLPWEFGQPTIFTSCRSDVPSTKHDFTDSTNGSERHFKFQALLPVTHL